MKLTWTIIPVLAGYFLACGPAEQPAPAQPPALSAADSLQRCAEADALLARADTASREKDSLLLRAAGLYQASRAAEAWVKTQRALFNFYRKNDDYDAAFEQLDAAVRAIWWPEDASTGQLHTLLGFTLRRLGRNYAASIHYEQARQISDRVGGVTRTNPAGPIYKTLANIKTRLGENEEAIKLLQAGLDLLARDTTAERRLDNRITQAEIYDDLGI
ncbi:MAG: tetratricopeptide repeat protein, partial [Saprospiraceae bacterium]|nr:tetratricopeptide repeat protein [Saprospiraceae bacterium]